MHIIIGILTAVGTILWALYRLHNSGVNLNSFNPFFWLRRRSWEKKLGTKPIHQLENPMEAAAVLVVGMALFEGDVTRELKSETIKLMLDEFGVSHAVAENYYSSSVFLLKDVTNLEAEVRNILAPSLSQFEPRHIDSLLSMLKTVASLEGDPKEKHRALIQAVETQFNQHDVGASKW